MSDKFDARQVSLLWAGAERADELAPLHAALFPDQPWDVFSFAETLAHPGSTAFIAQVGMAPKQTVGFIVGQLAADEAEILTLGVAPELQRRGIGMMLVEALLRASKRAEVRKLFLEVAADNQAALGLYAAAKFTEFNRRAAYYKRGDGEAIDALQLSRTL
ncbi:MAG: ribosomal protein S18-alanine N-acetyltransferase [Pseudomonadota bacterium]